MRFLLLFLVSFSILGAELNAKVEIKQDKTEEYWMNVVQKILKFLKTIEL